MSQVSFYHDSYLFNGDRTGIQAIQESFWTSRRIFISIGIMWTGFILVEQYSCCNWHLSIFYPQTPKARVITYDIDYNAKGWFCVVSGSYPSLYCICNGPSLAWRQNLLRSLQSDHQFSRWLLQHYWRCAWHNVITESWNKVTCACSHATNKKF